MNETKLSPELQDLAEIEGAAMCRQIQREAATAAHLMCNAAVALALDLMHDPELLKKYLDKFDLG